MTFKGSRAPVILLLASVLFPAARGIAAEAPPLTPGQAAALAGRVSSGVRQLTQGQGLQQFLQSKLNQLDKTSDSAAKDVAEMQRRYERANDLADQANGKAAEALKKAKAIAGKEDCDPKAVERLRKEAEKLMERAQKAKASAEDADLKKSVADDLNDLSPQEGHYGTHLDRLNEQLNNTLKEAEKAGLTENNNFQVKNLRDTQRLLDQKIAQESGIGTSEQGYQDRGLLTKFDIAADKITDKRVKKLKEELEKVDQAAQKMAKELAGAKEKLEAAARLLEDNCPPKKDVASAPAEQVAQAPSDQTATSIAGPSAASRSDQAMAVSSGQGGSASDCVVPAPDQRKDCGEHPQGTKVSVNTKGWWCSTDEQWENKLREELKAPNEALSALPSSLANLDRKASALGLTQPTAVLTAGPDEVTWKPCYNEEQLKAILAFIDAAVKRAAAEAAKSAGSQGQGPSK